MLALIREDPLVDEDQERMNKRLEKLEVRGKGTLGDKSHLRKSVVIERHSNSAYGESQLRGLFHIGLIGFPVVQESWMRTMMGGMSRQFPSDRVSCLLCRLG